MFRKAHKKSNGSKGFSVFTPMVGTLVLLITFLIVASMLESEKWNFQGLLETYQTVQVTGVSHEAQDRMVAVVRDSILSDIEKGFTISIDQCMSPDVTTSGSFGNWQAMNDTFGNCKKKTLNAVESQAMARVSGIGLSTSYVDALLKRITSKYALVKVYPNLCMDCNCEKKDYSGNCIDRSCYVYREVNGEKVKLKQELKFNQNNGEWEVDECKEKGRNGGYNSDVNPSVCGQPCVDPTSTVSDLKIVNCNAPSSYSSSIEDSSIEDNCEDGRLNVTLDFTKVKGMPIANIKANQSQYTEMQIYLPEHTENFVTSDPLAYYALRTAQLFEDFTLLDKTWHHAGGLDHGEYGNGSEWYQYKYAVHTRVPGGSVSDGSLGGTNESRSFWFSVNDKPVDLSKEPTTGSHSNWPSLSGSNNDDNLRLDNLLSSSVSSNPSSMDWKYFLYFLSGWARLRCYNHNITNTNFEWLKNYFEMETASTAAKCIFPGGNVNSTTAGWGNNISDLSGTIGLSGSHIIQMQLGSLNEVYKKVFRNITLVNESAFKIVDNVTDYDRKFFAEDKEQGDEFSPDNNDRLWVALQDMIDHVNTNTKLKTSAGYEENDKVKMNLTVKSEQIYSCTPSSGVQGGDNWYCGQWMAMYTPVITGQTVSSLISANGKSAIFLSLPLNNTCYTCVMHKVRETYTLYRNTHQDQEDVNKSVFRIRFTRWKFDYNYHPHSSHSDQMPERLWEGTAALDNGDIQNSTVEAGSGIKIRKCIYTCKGDSNNHGSCYYNCTWNENAVPTPYHIIGEQAP